MPACPNCVLEVHKHYYYITKRSSRKWGIFILSSRLPNWPLLGWLGQMITRPGLTFFMPSNDIILLIIEIFLPHSHPYSRASNKTIFCLRIYLYMYRHCKYLQGISGTLQQNPCRSTGFACILTIPVLFWKYYGTQRKLQINFLSF